MSSATLMTTAQYAAHRGVSDSYVRRLRREGRLVQVGRLIDVAATDAHLAATDDPLRGGDRSKPNVDPAAAGSSGLPPAGSLKEAVRRERLARARLAELELGEEQQQLTRRKDVDRAVFTLARQALERLRTIPGRLRAQLAVETDPRACEELLGAEVQQVCADLQRAAVEMATATTPAARQAAEADE